MSNVYALDFLRQEHVLDEVGSGRNSRYSSSHHKNSNNDDDDDDDDGSYLFLDWCDKLRDRLTSLRVLAPWIMAVSGTRCIIPYQALRRCTDNCCCDDCCVLS
mmetsp:Transcript_4456/g.9237  ORF Transcript_4456/g.9237 Transcript_4456/m.9237 type:complete len:103 (-) Transcript_4456:1354-1662(-)